MYQLKASHVIKVIQFSFLCSDFVSLTPICSHFQIHSLHYNSLPMSVRFLILCSLRKVHGLRLVHLWARLQLVKSPLRSL